jgi:hypothetical protein
MMQNISYPNNADQVRIGSLQVKPTITRQQLKTKIGKQTGMYTIAANNIVVNKMDLAKLVKDNA